MDDIIRIIIADDHAIFRAGLKLILDGISNCKVIAEASDGKDLLQCLNKFQADIVFIDIKMPHLDGIETTRQIRAKYPGLSIIALSMYSEIEYFNQMREAGVEGFLLKNTQSEELKEAINTISNGEQYFAKEFAQLVPGRVKKGKIAISLTNREKEILQLICNGLSTNEIAEKLHLSSHTVEGHRKNIMFKADCSNTASLVAFSIKNQIVDI
jgi:DNA-binding NarL/FixJ family response regulator